MPPTTSSTTTSTATAVDRIRLRRLARTGGLAAAVLVTAVTGSLATTALAGDRVFTDVGADHPFAADIDFVADTGIAEGFDDGTFRPNEPVSRQAMAAFLRRASTYRLIATSSGASNAANFGATVSCDGDVAVGGGGSFSGSGRAFMTASQPTPGATGWRVAFTTDGGATISTGTVTVFAVCAPGQLPAPNP